MNQKLLELMNRPLREETRQQIINEMLATHPFDEHFDKLNNVAIVRLISVIAAYVTRTCARIFQSNDIERRWENILLAQGISDNMKELIQNPALLYYTQTVLLLCWAIMKGEQDHEHARNPERVP